MHDACRNALDICWGVKTDVLNKRGVGGFHEAGFVDEIEEDVELVFETVEVWEVHRGEGGWSAVKSPKQKTLKEEENPWTKDKL